MDLVTRFERRFGRFALPGIVQTVAVMQFLTLVLIHISNPEAQVAFTALLELDPDRILRGEVWRIFSHIFLPRTLSPIWAIIALFFMFFIGRGLDEAWGSFRVNLYVIGGALSLTLGALLFGYSGGGIWLFQTLLFAFAVFYPNQEIMLFFVIPIKIKWLAIFGGVLIGLTVLGTPSMFWQVLFANLNFLIAFGPAFIKQSAERARIMERRNQFAATQGADGGFFHQCCVCKKTEIDDPKLEFRVRADGEEICDQCRESQSPSDPSGAIGNGGSAS